MTAYKIAQYRAAGVTQADVAEKLGITERTVRSCEKRGFRATTKKLEIADRHSRLIENYDDGNYRTHIRSWEGKQMNTSTTPLYNYEFTGTNADFSSMSPEEYWMAMETLEEYSNEV